MNVLQSPYIWAWWQGGPHVIPQPGAHMLHVSRAVGNDGEQSTLHIPKQTRASELAPGEAKQWDWMASLLFSPLNWNF